MSEKNDPATPAIPPDPIYQKSLSIPIFLAALAVLGATALAIVDEFYLRRPYKGIQKDWQATYSEYLGGLAEARGKAVEDGLMKLDAYAELEAAVVEADTETKAGRTDVSRRIRNIDSQLKSLIKLITIPRSEIAAENYKAEHAAAGEGMSHIGESEGARPHLERIAEIRNTEAEYTWPATNEAGEPVEEKKVAPLGEHIADMPKLQEEKASLQKRLGSVAKDYADAVKARGKWLNDNLDNIAYLVEAAENNDDEATVQAIGEKASAVGVSRYLDRHVASLKKGQILGLKSIVDDWSIGDLGKTQIHLPGANNWVDRCETCHLNTRAQIPVNAEDMGGNALFASHPRKAELLGTHDPETFGCSMCHGGNGISVTSEEQAHGLDHYWLNRLHPSTNTEAGCIQCHVEDIFLEGGERVSQAKENYRHFGCWGCHKMSTYDSEPEEIRATAKRLTDIEDAIAAKQRRSQSLQAVLIAVSAADEENDTEKFDELEPETARERASLQLEIAAMQTEAAILRHRLGDLYGERKKVGPNLKDLRAKVKRGWVTQWLRDPRSWRPSTKMPAFRWDSDEEVKDVAAFLWQAAIDVDKDRGAYKIARAQPGDPTKGEALFMTVGCLSCHQIDLGDETIGKGFAANLTDLGEKSTLEHVLRWIQNPRHRLAPYCDDCKRDLTPEDFAQAGKDFAFSREYKDCPNCGHELQWDNPVVMPSFRLTEKESRDIATYLLQHGGGSGADFDDGAWLEDTERFESGKRLVQFHGCAGCHEIAGLEDEQRIGTELSVWGSKPMDRLDFGHYTTDAKRGTDPLIDWEAPGDGRAIFAEQSTFYPHDSWYQHRGFALHKLAEPDIYDTSKNTQDRWARLRMPKFNLSGQQILDIATLLMGSVETRQLPEAMKYTPDDRGQAIREGWWIVRKYNCEGCHQIRPGEVPAIKELPHFQPGQANEGDAPPYLVGTGFRTRPEFLGLFLHDPSLGGGTSDPKALRPHLSVRMPTFSFTDSEVAKVVAFFDAMAKQPGVYQIPPFKPLSSADKRVADGIFKDAKCTQCHVVTGMALTDETKAPNLTWAGPRLRPEWMARWLQNPTELEPGTAMPALFRLECANCQTWHDSETLGKLQLEGRANRCTNCDHDLNKGRWVYQNKAFAPATGYQGDHIDLMVRYLRSLKDS